MGKTPVNLILATSNVHKLAEIRMLLPDCYAIKGISELGFTGEIPETGVTFTENALIKARFVHQKFHANVLADDSGLEVDALGGRPGVYSARFAGEGCTAEDNMSLLLHELGNEVNRKARFRAVLALIIDGNECLFEGACEGTIAKDKSGKTGFGYDPVFIPEGYSRTFAEMDADLKNSMSHRGIAVKKLSQFLENYRV